MLKAALAAFLRSVVPSLGLVWADAAHKGADLGCVLRPRTGLHSVQELLGSPGLGFCGQGGFSQPCCPPGMEQLPEVENSKGNTVLNEVEMSNLALVLE